MGAADSGRLAGEGQRQRKVPRKKCFLGENCCGPRRLTPSWQRTRLLAALQDTACIGLGAASVREIDRLNILNATLLAMARATRALSRQLGRAPDLALVDGNRAPALLCPARTVVGGDGKCLSIAAASIAAKVVRDRAMTDLATVHPGYGWERNAGYGTAEHRLALTLIGPTPHHRLSFKPLRTQHFVPR